MLICDMLIRSLHRHSSNASQHFIASKNFHRITPSSPPMQSPFGIALFPLLPIPFSSMGPCPCAKLLAPIASTIHIFFCITLAFSSAHVSTSDAICTIDLPRPMVAPLYFSPPSHFSSPFSPSPFSLSLYALP